MLVLIAAMALKAPATLPLIPLPLQIKEGSGAFLLKETVPAVVDEACAFEAKELRQILREVGARMERSDRLPRGKAGISVLLDSQGQSLGQEGYALDVDRASIRIRAFRPAGAFYALQTLRQLLMARNTAPFEVPEVHIVDKPRFGWRGMLLDVSRHFFDADEIERALDHLARLKMNVFHWHLVDDGGWRVEIKKHPELTEKGGWRTDVPGVTWSQWQLEFPGRSTGKKLYGGFYTQDQVREIVRYAAERHITIVPEIEMPGHSLAAVEAYPELGCEIEKAEGHAYRTNVFCAGKDSTMTFLQDVLDEVLELFPSKIIHIGGDEVDKGYWRRCPRCNNRMEKQGLKDYNELQSDFIKRAETYLNSKGRTLIGWDEILEGGLAPNAMVMSWRGTEGGIAAAKAGHDVVMSPTSHCYFDYSYDSTSTEHAYGYDPIPKELSPEEVSRVKGGQANVWTEWIPSFDRVEYMTHPRILAMAEVLWTPRDRMYWPSFKQRLEPHLSSFVKRGVDFYVGKPAFDANLIVFNDSCTLNLAAPAIRGIDLKYTLSGQDPNGGSAILTGPLKLDKSGVVSAAYVKGGKVLEGPARATVLKGVPKVQPVPGISFRLFSQRFERMPDWNKLAPAQQGTAAAFDISPYAATEAFGLQWNGFLKVEKEGLYTFTLGSDDGSVLKLAGATIVDNDGLHAYVEKTGKAVLLPGVYAFEIGFFEAGGAERFEAYVEGPGLPKRRLEEIVLK